MAAKLTNDDRKIDLTKPLVLFKMVKGDLDCKDRDEDCEDIPDKVKCYLHDPNKGMCPYLRSEK